MSSRQSQPHEGGAPRRGPGRSARKASTALLLCATLVGSGCFHYRAIARTDIAADDVGGSIGPATEYERQTVWALGWGLYQQSPDIDNCQGQDLYEVTMSTNLAYALLTVATLGLVAPMAVKWKCAKAQPTEGDLPGPDPGGAGDRNP